MKSITLGCIASLLSILFLSSSCKHYANGSKPDNNFDVVVQNPELIKSKPRVLYDEAHKNIHEIHGTYEPFGKLIKNDGCVVSSTDKKISDDLLTQADIYISVTAQGSGDTGEKNTYSEGEINALEKWINNGGSALIITEHFPFSLSMATLLRRFNVEVFNGMADDSTMVINEGGNALQFQKLKGQINNTHPITANINTVNTFFGSSLKADTTFTPLLLLSDNAENYNVKSTIKKEGGDTKVEIAYVTPHSAKGYYQGVCKQYGKGRLVVLSESAMLTAQIDKKGKKFGINLPNEDNKQFALNIIRWLANKLR